MIWSGSGSGFNENLVWILSGSKPLNGSLADSCLDSKAGVTNFIAEIDLLWIINVVKSFGFSVIIIVWQKKEKNALVWGLDVDSIATISTVSLLFVVDILNEVHISKDFSLIFKKFFISIWTDFYEYNINWNGYIFLLSYMFLNTKNMRQKIIFKRNILLYFLTL